MRNLTRKYSGLMSICAYLCRSSVARFRSLGEKEVKRTQFVSGRTVHATDNLLAVAWWVKFVALLMTLFVVLDVCTPEPCDAQTVAPVRSQSQVQAQYDGSTTPSCQFEEDCFSCAHYAPGVIFAFQPVAVVLFEESDPLVPLLDGMPHTPYRPPRS
jgi:hypothetical protein